MLLWITSEFRELFVKNQLFADWRKPKHDCFGNLGCITSEFRELFVKNERTQENINTIVSGTFRLDLFNFIFRQHFLRQNFLHNLSSMWCIGFLSPSLSLSCMCHWLNLKPFLANRAPLILASSVNTQQRRNLFVVSFYFGIDYLLFRWLTLIKFCKYSN